MSKKTQVRARRAKFMVIALVTVLALLVAPVCAPLCAARGCPSNAFPGTEKCHEMANMGSSGSEKLDAPCKLCGASYLSAVLVNTEEQSSLSSVSLNDATPVRLIGSRELSLSHLQTSPEHDRVHPPPIELANLSLLTTTLRI
jgi:hypothetical protein